MFSVNEQFLILLPGRDLETIFRRLQGVYRNVHLVNDTLEQILNVYIYMITGLLLWDFGIKFNALLFLDFEKKIFFGITPTWKLKF